MNEIDRVEAEFEDEEVKKLTNRGKEWRNFSNIVQDHVEFYTVPQYKDYPEDQLTNFTISDVASQLKRYVNRISSNSRGLHEAKRDCLKMAHYSCVLYSKLDEFSDHSEKMKETVESEKATKADLQLIWNAIIDLRKAIIANVKY